jgi:Flp pilus assembly pilin Flp
MVWIITRARDRGRGIIHDDSGQAVVEYAVALTLFIIVILCLGTLVRGGQETAHSGLHAQTFSRAPYTITSSVGSSGQCFKDIMLR